MIEKILYKHLEERKDYKPVQQENRRYPRKMITAPALITELGSENTSPKVGIVVDISLNGLHFSIPDNYQYDIQEAGRLPEFPLYLRCPIIKDPSPCNTYPTARILPDETRIGASLIDTDFASYQALQNYLVH